MALTRSAGTARLQVDDDGPGFPDSFDAIRAANTGLELVEAVGRWDLQGSITYQNRDGGGAQVAVEFPLLVAPEQDPTP